MGYKQINARRRGMNTLSQAIMMWAMQKDKEKRDLEKAELARQANNEATELQLKLLDIQGKIDKASAGEEGSVGFNVGSKDNPRTIHYKEKNNQFQQIFGNNGYFEYGPDGKLTFHKLPKEEDFSSIISLAEKDPNAAYEQGYRITDDGKLYIDKQTSNPVKLPSFTDAMGKRGTVKEVKLVGELWDDAKELKTLLSDPEVAKTLGDANESGVFNEGIFDRVTGRVKNKVQKWMSEKGIAPNSKTATAIRRMQMLASEKRKEFLGSAITETELKSVLSWLPDASDSYSAMLNKINLFEYESQQNLERWLDLYKDTANMTPFYKAFGMKRFSSGVQNKDMPPSVTPKEAPKKINNDPLGIRN